MQMSLCNQCKRSVDFASRADDFDICQILGFSGYFDRRIYSQYEIVANHDFHLRGSSIGSHHSHFLYFSFLSDKRNGFFAGVLAWLSNVFEFLEFISWSEKLISFALA